MLYNTSTPSLSYRGICLLNVIFNTSPFQDPGVISVLFFAVTFTIELSVALETRGTLIILAPSEVLRFPESILFPGFPSPGPK